MTWTVAVPAPNALGESPFWHPEEKRLYWVDIAARSICRTDPTTCEVQYWQMPSEPGCIAPARSGGQSEGLVIALRDGVYRAQQWGGTLALLAPALHDTATTRFNDGKADPLGRFWVGVYGPRDAPRSPLFCLDRRNGSSAGLQAMACTAVSANGLAWSPDAATLYWADTPSHSVRAWNWNAEANCIGQERLFAQWSGKPSDWQPGMPGYGGRPDGAAVDAAGNYYVAMYEGGRLLKLSPTGALLADIAVPAQCPTMPCFGGPDLRTLYLTTARQHRPAEELGRWPLSGCVLSMRVDTAGLPVNFFAD